MMPNMANFNMSLSEEDDVSFILNHMPQLEVLNGIRVERNQLFSHSASQSEDPSQTNSIDQGTILVSNRQIDS
jgi:hypothetical protein